MVEDLKTLISNQDYLTVLDTILKQYWVKVSKGDKTLYFKPLWLEAYFAVEGGVVDPYCDFDERKFSEDNLYFLRGVSLKNRTKNFRNNRMDLCLGGVDNNGKRFAFSILVKRAVILNKNVKELYSDACLAKKVLMLMDETNFCEPFKYEFLVAEDIPEVDQETINNFTCTTATNLRINIDDDKKYAYYNSKYLRVENKCHICLARRRYFKTINLSDIK